MKVIYSIAARLAGGGIGNIACHAMSAVFRHGYLEKAVVSSARPTSIDPRLIKTQGFSGRVLKRLSAMNPRLDALANASFDRWASLQVGTCDIFHGWNAFSLYSMRKARTLGAISVIERASTHPIAQAQIIDREYEKWGLDTRVPQLYLDRMLKELEEADYVIIPSDFVFQSFLEQGFDERKLICLPFGVDINRFVPTAERQEEKDRPFRALFVGQVSVRKGVPYLLEAWKRLALANAELIILGNVFSEMNPIINRLGAIPNIQFLGHVNDPVELFRSADAFVFPSIEEGSALVTYEAMASGLPVITTPNAGSMINDGGEGFLVSAGDVDGLAERICQLYENRHQRLEMGQAARKKVESHTWERYGDNLVEAYRRILALQKARDMVG